MLSDEDAEVPVGAVSALDAAQAGTNDSAQDVSSYSSVVLSGFPSALISFLNDPDFEVYNPVGDLLDDRMFLQPPSEEGDTSSGEGYTGSESEAAESFESESE